MRQVVPLVLLTLGILLASVGVIGALGERRLVVISHATGDYRVRRGEVIVHPFSITNRTLASISYAYTGACGCSLTETPVGVVRPLETKTMHIRVDTSAFDPGPVHMRGFEVQLSGVLDTWKCPIVVRFSTLPR